MSGPSLLLLDEPLAAVDVPLRRRILPYLQRVRDELTVPIIYVSHDREEVDELADVVVNVDAGRVVSVIRFAAGERPDGLAARSPRHDSRSLPSASGPT